MSMARRMSEKLLAAVAITSCLYMAGGIFIMSAIGTALQSYVLSLDPLDGSPATLWAIAAWSIWGASVVTAFVSCLLYDALFGGFE